ADLLQGRTRLLALALHLVERVHGVAHRLDRVARDVVGRHRAERLEPEVAHEVAGRAALEGVDGGFQRLAQSRDPEAVTLAEAGDDDPLRAHSRDLRQEARIAALSREVAGPHQAPDQPVAGRIDLGRGLPGPAVLVDPDHQAPAGAASSPACRYVVI